MSAMGPDSSRRSPLRRGLGRLALVTALAVAVACAIIIQRSAAPGAYLIKIPTADASGIYAGSDVTIAGVRAGQVSSVSLAPSGDAVITAALDPAFAPVHADATAQIRPRSLLGEMYVNIDPGTAGPALASGAALPRLQINRSADLQQVFKTFNQPTRAKLQTLIDELGGGLTGRGAQLNQAIPSATHDVSDLAAISATLNSRNAELQSVISSLNAVTTELARSNRRQQLGTLISSTQELMASLKSEQARLQAAVVSADFALGSLKTGLQGTAPALAGIAGALPADVQAGTSLLGPLTTDSAAMLPQVGNLVQGIQLGSSVFGGRDANGYATRISLTLGCGSIATCSQLTAPLSGATGSGLPAGTLLPAGKAGQPGTAGTAPGAPGGAQGILGFLLGGNP